jgi:hypothetical protein
MDPAVAVERALPVFGRVRPGDWSGLRVGVTMAGVLEPTASELLAFVPIAFGRAILDGMGVQFSPEYAAPDGAGGTRVVGLLADHPVYAAAAARTAEMMERQEGGDTLVAVAVWSSEFSALNQALGAGSNPADLVAAPPLPTTQPPWAANAKPRPSPTGKPWWRIWG